MVTIFRDRIFGPDCPLLPSRNLDNSDCFLESNNYFVRQTDICLVMLPGSYFSSGDSLWGKLSVCLVCRVYEEKMAVGNAVTFNFTTLSHLTSGTVLLLLLSFRRIIFAMWLMSHLYLSVSSQICFVNLDPQKTDCRDDKIIKVSQIHVPPSFCPSCVSIFSFPPTFHLPGTVYCISHTNIDSVAMDSKSLPKIRGLICLDNMQISQPPAAGGGTGGRSIIIPQGSGVLTGRIFIIICLWVGTTEKKRRVQNLFFSLFII